MAVRFVLGPAGSGKTHRCLELLRAREISGRQGIYLVPEQFTYSADRELLEDPRLAGLSRVRVLSFSRLAHWLRNLAGVPEPSVISAPVRAMLLRRVLADAEGAGLEFLGPLKHRIGFLSDLGRFVSEVRNHGPVDFLAAFGSEAGVPAGVDRKLRGLAKVYEAYALELRNLGREDPEELLARVTPLVQASSARLGEIAFFVDGFLSWTRRERDILVALAAVGESCEITLCLDPADPRPVFDATRRSYERLRLALDGARVSVEAELVLGRATALHRFAAPALAQLEANYFGDASPPLGGSDAAVVIVSAPDRRDEVLYWARQLDRWLRLETPPVRADELAVIVRDVEPYRAAIEEIFPRYAIPYFLDERRGLLAQPRVRFLLGAFEILLSGWRRDAVIAWLRNPLHGVAPASVDWVENLSLQLGRDFEDWYTLSRWQEVALPLPRAPLPTRGGAESEEPERRATPSSEEGEESDEPGDPEAETLGESEEEASRAEPGMLSLAERLVRGPLAALRALELRWGTGLTGVAAAASCRELLALAGEDAVSSDPDEWAERVSEAIEELLDEAAGLWPELPVDLSEFARTLRDGLDQVRLGVTPIRLEQVSVADIRRSRLQNIRRAIVGGWNEGLFPRVAPDGPVVNETDREALRQLGVPLGPNASERQAEEVYLSYIALTRSAERLVLTYAKGEAMGTTLGESFFLEEVKRALPELVARETAAEGEGRTAESVQTAFEMADCYLGAASAGEEALRASMEPVREWPAAELQAELELGLRVSTRPASEFLPPEMTLWLSPEGILRSSVSRLEGFSRCPFQSFAKNLLRLEPRPEARVSPVETGTLAHAALEAVLGSERVSGSNLAQELGRVVGALRQRPEYVGFDMDPAARHRLASTERSLLRFLRVELNRLEGSPYYVAAREQPFGDDPPFELALADGTRLRLRGRIDRLDRRDADEGSYVVVIDYKSSARGAVQSRMEAGRDLQLGAYLLFVRDVLGQQPAGGLYVPVIPRPIAEEKRGSDPQNPLGIRAAGIVLESERAAVDGGAGLLTARARSGRLESEQEMGQLLDRVGGHLKSYATAWNRGWIAVSPLDDGGKLPCRYCEFGALCRFRPDRDPVRHDPTAELPPGGAEGAA